MQRPPQAAPSASPAGADRTRRRRGPSGTLGGHLLAHRAATFRSPVVHLRPRSAGATHALTVRDLIVTGAADRVAPPRAADPVGHGRSRSGKYRRVRHAVPHDDHRDRPSPARRPRRPVVAARERRRPRRAVRPLRRLGRGERHHAVPGAGGGADRAGQRRERRPGHADRLGQVAGRHRRAVRRAGGRTAQLLHRADQGAGQREVLRAVRRLRRGQRRHAHRRRGGQRRRADHRLHRGGAGQHRPARGRRRRHRPRRDGRVPLLRRPRPRLGLAGAAAGAAERAVPADVGHARRRHVPARGPHPPHRPADGAGRQRRAPGAAAPLLRDHADARDDRRPARHAGRRRSTSSTSPRPRRWSGRRR